MSEIQLAFKLKLLCFGEKKGERSNLRGPPSPTPSLPRRRKGFVCAVRAPLIEFINTHRPGAGKAWAARLYPTPAPGRRQPRETEWQYQGQLGAGAPAAEEEEDAAPPGTRGRGPAARTSAGPFRPGRAHKPPFVLRLRGRKGLRRLQLSPPTPSPRFLAGPARSCSGPRAPPLTLPAVGLGAPDLPAPRGRQTPVSPGGGEARKVEEEEEAKEEEEAAT